MPSSPVAEYQRRIALFDEALAAGERRHHLLANLRLGTAGLAMLIAWLAFGASILSPFLLFVPLVGFVALVVAHARVLEKNERTSRARDMYRRGISRIEGHWAGTGPDGARFLEGHPYARDLDLFGPASLFQLLNTARTQAGEDTLASWIAGPAGIDEIMARQEAVRDLTPQIDFRESLAVVAAEARVSRTGSLAAWARHAPAGLPLSVGILHGVVGAVMAALLVLAWYELVPVFVVVTWAGVTLGVSSWWRTRVAEVVHAVSSPSDDLMVFTDVLAILENATVSSPRLAGLEARLRRDGAPPSALLSRLQSYVSLLNHTEHNPYIRLLGAPLLLRAQAAVAVDRWHAAHRAALADWITVVGEFEALAALATYAYEHPADQFPSVMPDGPLFEASTLAHPLLPGAGGVPNDVELGGSQPRLLVVSGSNMSGKSTLLRAVGVNTVLALAGAPVRASRLTLSILSIGATITVDDSLQAGHSRFYTEVLRIKGIIDLTRGPRPALFLLDEILHGTNSHDRRVGAEAILRALVAAGAIGLVTTHDLALTELVASLGPVAANVHFQDSIEDGRMTFDYRMRPGIVEHSNALELMRAVGLDV